MACKVLVPDAVYPAGRVIKSEGIAAGSVPIAVVDGVVEAKGKRAAGFVKLTPVQQVVVKVDALPGTGISVDAAQRNIIDPRLRGTGR